MSESKIAEKEARIAKLRQQQKQKESSSESDNDSEEEPVVKKKPVKKPTPKKKSKHTSSSDDASSDEELDLKRLKEKVRLMELEEKKKKKKPVAKKKPATPSTSESESSDSEEEIKKKKTSRRKPKYSESEESSSEEEKPKPKPKKPAKHKKSRSPSPPKAAPVEPVKPITSAKLEELRLLKERMMAEKMAMGGGSKTTSSGTVEQKRKELEELKKRVAERSVGADVRLSALEEEKKELLRREYGLDICFLMDCTGSMSPWLTQAKNHCRTIMTEAIKINEKVIPRIAFVGYRDHCDGADRLSVIDFQGMNQAEVLKNQLDKCPAKGGGDGPEDVAGGLNAVLSLSWIASTRLVIHIADAPCHGNAYHGGRFKDDYPDGDPLGLVPEILLGKMCDKRIDFYFCKIENYTDIMMNIFQKVYVSRKKPFQVHNLGENPETFLPATIKSLTESMSRSAALSRKL